MRSKLPSSILALAALGAALAGLSCPTPARAQTASKPAPAAAKPPSLVKKPEISNFDLKSKQRERLQKYLPKALVKLSHRDPFHVVVIGDEIVGMAAHNDDDGDMLKAWPVRFVDELGSQFLYTGGVRVIHPTPGKLAKTNAQMGQEITVRCLPRTGGTMPQAMQQLTTYGFDSMPDLVIVSFGIHDAESPADLGMFAKALQQVIDTVQAKGSELVLVGPTLTAGDSASTSLGSTRAFAGMMAEAAEAANVMFADAGDRNGLVKLDITTLQPANLVESTVTQYRRFFAWRGEDDFIHPVAELHRILGGHVFNEAVDGAKASPWKLAPGSATFDKTGHLNVTVEVANTTKEPLKLCAAALQTRSWKSLTALPKFELNPGAKQVIKLSYERSNTPADAQVSPLASHEAFLRLPLLITNGGVTRVEEIHTELKPLALLWRMDTLYNQQGGFTLDNVIANSSGAALKAAWTGEWNGQKKSGTLDLAKGATAVLPLKFDLPKSGTHESKPLVLDVNVNGTTLRWQRFIECTSNLGLKQDRNLLPLGQNKGRVRLHTDADVSWLYLVFDVDGVDLETTHDGMAMRLQLSLDARSYGKRLAFGSIEPLTLRVGATAGGGTTASIAPWAFGTGYGMEFDPSYVRSQLSTNASGSHRLTVTLPRNYLYLHEWALGNGNSELGFNARLSFWHDGGFPLDATYSITSNPKTGSDAEGLAALELTSTPTSRWSVVIW